ncbi:hypothetical protein GGQ64_003376 [Rhizobium azooxidifex]|uniref:Uncharacterized protein n=1 Tax=Mycoplana azooxidifex TaxID=1636188 RepID=A0A7W6DCM3_9HYPH|nr:hypothetical protein [Mycoplana azooxidifex]MBB3978162.1 hypothetical protein [Mycoplana azooxidifex]
MSKRHNSRQSFYWSAFIAYAKATWWLVALVLFILLDAPQLAQMIGIETGAYRWLSAIGWVKDVVIALTVWAAGFLACLKMLAATGSFRVGKKAWLRPLARAAEELSIKNYVTSEGGVSSFAFSLGVQHLGPGITNVEVFVDRINGEDLSPPLPLQKRDRISAYGTGDIEVFNVASAWVRRPMSPKDTAMAEKAPFDQFRGLLERGLLLETEPTYRDQKLNFPNLIDLTLDFRIESANSPIVNSAILIRVQPRATTEIVESL